MTVRTDVLVIGAGLSGLAAAARLHDAGRDVLVLEKNAYRGGHAASHVRSGFTFDEGPHVSFTKRPEIQELFATALGGEYTERGARIINDWRGTIIPHPVQCNLYGLPEDLVERAIVDFVRRPQPAATPDTYDAWCLAAFGETISREFVFPYTRKYWTTDASNMTSEWAGERVYSPALEDVVGGALRRTDETHHYFLNFRYPRSGGFGRYVESVRSGARVVEGAEVVRIDHSRKELETGGGERISYESLISSMPLPLLLELLDPVPSEVREAGRRLICTSVVVTTVGVSRQTGFPEADWMYFYDDDIVFSRMNFPHRLAAANAPAGCGSVQVETYFSPYRSLEMEGLQERVMADLIRCGVLRSDDSIVMVDQRIIPFANVLFDLNRREAVQKVRGFLDGAGIGTCGRYGEWDYLWSDDSVISGWRAADALLGSGGSSR